MSKPRAAPFGTWKSPLSADTFAAGTVSLDEVVVNRSNGRIYLLEMRPAEGGRGCVVEIGEDGSSPRDVLPKEYNALTHVHEYGGASFTTRGGDGHIIFSDFHTNLVVDLDPATLKAEPIVDEDPKNYFADFNVHPKDSKWVLAIKEDHHSSKIDEVENTLVAIDSHTKTVRTIVSGADFYAYPRFSPDGRRVCWTQWNHPNMPWNYNELWVAEWQEGKVFNAKVIAGDDVQESITQPQWGEDGSIFFVGDRTGFWQIYQFVNDELRYIHVKGLERAEFGAPEWWLGSSTYAPLTSEKLVAFYNLDGAKKAIVIAVATGDFTDPDIPINDVGFSAVKRTSPNSFAVIGSTADHPKALYHINLDKPTNMQSLKTSIELPFPKTFLSTAQSIKYPRTRGSSQDGHAHGLFFPPTNPGFTAPQGTLPPLIVAIHGGPTWQTGPGLSLRDQYWTTRGYALVQINYVGSSGYGKEYASLLNSQWGVADIADAASAVDYLASQGLIDRKAVGITGLSAGGYATMQALAVYPDIFAAGVAESGISDLQAMVDETHKFESQYLQPLCFPANTTTTTASDEDRKRTLRERSPIHQAHRITSPLLILGGSEDKIVPPTQATGLAERIRKEHAGKVEVQVVIYDGEGHIFTGGENVRDCVQRMEGWWARFLLGKD